MGTTHSHSDSLVFQRIVGSIGASIEPDEVLDDHDGDTAAADSNTPCAGDQAEGCGVMSGVNDVEASGSIGELGEDAPPETSTLLMSPDSDARGTNVPV